MLHSDLSVIQLQCNDIALGEYISGRGDALRRGSIESRAILGAVSLVAVFCHTNCPIAISCVSSIVFRRLSRVQSNSRLRSGRQNRRLPPSLRPPPISSLPAAAAIKRLRPFTGSLFALHTARSIQCHTEPRTATEPDLDFTRPPITYGAVAVAVSMQPPKDKEVFTPRSVDLEMVQTCDSMHHHQSIARSSFKLAAG